MDGYYSGRTDGRCCEYCKYFDLSTFEKGDVTSWCHRHPPVYIGPDMGHIKDLEDSPCVTDYWEFPTVAIRSLCGEWEPRNEPDGSEPVYSDTVSEVRGETTVSETDRWSFLATDENHYAYKETMHVFRCAMCGNSYERVLSGPYSYCPHCGREVGIEFMDD